MMKRYTKLTEECFANYVIINVGSDKIKLTCKKS